ncbi:MAG: helix-turn-helix domain-containing protein [Chitinophagaceae bacterium]
MRNKKQLTQEDIANIIGISRSYISDVERTNSRAKYNIRHINALADYFGISPRDFFPESQWHYFIQAEKSMKEK